jgi:hypothetical protein
MDRPYATPEGVRTYLTSLMGLHALRDARRDAYARRELLTGFCVLGVYVLTEDGGFGELTGVSKEPIGGLPDVVTFEEFNRFGRRHHGARWTGLSYRKPAPLAPIDDICPVCGNGWTFSQRADVVSVAETCTYMTEEHQGWFLHERTSHMIHRHAACHAADEARDALWWAEDILDRAGFPFDAEPKPCPVPEKAYAPWFRLETPVGAIRFGRRGRGYAIDWSETGRDLMGRFCRIEARSVLADVWNEPPVPHGPHFVDPKDEAYLLLYLDRLRQALGL